MTEALPGVRPPRQARSREAFERVLDAGVALLEEQGVEGFQIVAIADRAGVSVGTIYNRFDGKDALFQTVHQRFVALMDARSVAVFEDESWSTLSAAEVVERAVRETGALLREQSALLRAFMMHANADPSIAVRASAGARKFARRFEAVLLARSAEFRAPGPPWIAADLCFRMVYDVLARRVMWGATFETDLETTWEQTVDGLVDACQAYLLGSAALSPRSAAPS